MSKKRSSNKARKKVKTFVESLRDWLTPAIWKQGHQAHTRKQRRCSWDIQPLVLVLLCLTWANGPSQEERFETARGFCVCVRPKRRRPGETYGGFLKALGRLPMPVLFALARGIRLRIFLLLAPILVKDGFIPIGCDGSRIECPRTEELERNLPSGGKSNAAPSMWVTALVHLSSGMLLAWFFGPGDSSERHHLLQLLQTLPAQALLVTDAGYPGYKIFDRLLLAEVSFLIRVSSNQTFYTKEGTAIEKWQEGPVYYWTDEAMTQGQAPLPLRLICIREKRRKVDVWLVTNVDAKRLSVEQAGKYYRMRWENEGLFRSYKRTMKKVKLQSETLSLLKKELQGSLIAVQLMLAMGTYAILQKNKKGSKGTKVASVAKIARAIRNEMTGPRSGRKKGNFFDNLSNATREQRQRTTPKEKRPWPARKPHTQPKAPILLKIDDTLTTLFDQWLQ